MISGLKVSLTPFFLNPFNNNFENAFITLNPTKITNSTKVIFWLDSINT
ncbi:MAG: hypothetical protein ACJASM_003197 [Salibacteraceae bacterium]|jgi:hypothetical protein